ncbi:MAG: 4-hydroxy-tetrahydrodipicolinate synthase [Chthoniobacter sp.]|nr:4-hydroxy-tetrahydrodipicolinate synthase [Chthoniobacter sp.]
MFAGTFTALVTPFKNDLVDEDAFAALIEKQIEAGITGIIPVGTTGESPTLSDAEHRRVIELGVKFARGRCQVIGGTGSNSTSEAVSMTMEAEKLGCDGALLIAPYYNKPSQEGLYHHFAKIARATKLPLILYSIPGRCGIEIGVEVTARLAKEFPNIVAMKEAGGTVERVSALRAVVPEAFTVLSGDDSLTLPFMAAGAVGVISVATNIVPAEVVALVKAALKGDYAKARELHFKLYPLFKDLFIEPNPVPIKFALAAQGRMLADVRLPLCEMAPSRAAKLTTTLRQLKLI